MLLLAAQRSRHQARPALLAVARRGLANKVFETAEAAVKDIKDGSKL